MTTEAMATDPIDDPALIEAADFLLRVQAAPRDADLRAEVEAWLRIAPAHQQAWDRVRTSWSMLGELPTVSPPQQAAPRRELPRRAGSVRRRWTVAAATAVAACLVAALAPSAVLRLRADVVTGIGERRALTLADGSRMVLGPQSAVAFSKQGRGVTLVSGQAWFEVEHDAARPFVVEAGAVRATDLGTAFEVRRRRGSVDIAVAHGLVGVSGLGVDQTLAPGDRIEVAPGAVRKERRALDAIAPWRDGYLLVEDASVAEVVAELRRYQPGVVMVTDKALGERRVTGLYAVDQPEAALRALVAPSGGRVHSLTPYVHLLSPR